MISVFLNNEREIILDTLLRNIPSLLSDSGDEVIVAYRTEGDLPEEEQLKSIANSNPNLRVMKVEMGHGKSDQMNEAIKIAKNSTIRFLDADAIVTRLCAQSYQHKRMKGNFDFTQGVNLIRNTDSVLARIASVEYVIKYLIAQYARNRAIGLTYFCGSNGTWQKTVIGKLNFSNASLVEDVEVSLRANIAGYYGSFLPMMVATELAPNRFIDWWHQRKRWAHGWFEAGALHWKELLFCNMTWPKKLNWIYLIWFRRGLYSTIYSWFFLYSFAYLIVDIAGPAKYLSIILLWHWILSFSQAIIAKRQLRIVTGQDLPVGSMILYIAAFPIYDALKCLVTFSGWGTWIEGNREWRVTPRR